MTNLLPTLCMAFLLNAPAKKEEPKKEMPSPIVGDWECVGIVVGGREIPHEVIKDMSCTFTADGKCRRAFDLVPAEGTYKLDPTKDPAHIDFTTKGQTSSGIYKIDRDTLVLCYGEGDSPRPDKFASGAGQRIFVMTFKRVLKKE